MSSVTVMTHEQDITNQEGCLFLTVDWCWEYGAQYAQHMFLVEIYATISCYRICHHKFCLKCPGVNVPSKSMIRDIGKINFVVWVNTEQEEQKMEFMPRHVLS